MTESKIDDLIASALEQYTLDELREVIEDSSLDFETSSLFRRRMLKMLRDPLRYLANWTRPAWQKVLRTAAAILLALLTLFGASMSIPSVRAFVERIWTEWYEDHFSIRFPGATVNVDDFSDIRWRPTMIPEGYEEIVVRDFPEDTIIQYVHASAPKITFDYVLVSEGTSLNFDTEHSTQYPLTFNGHDAHAFVQNTPEDSSFFIWYDQTQQYVFTLSGKLPVETLIDIAKSVKII